MAHSSNKDMPEELKSAASADKSLPERIAELCQNEAACLMRTPGNGHVKTRTLDPNEKPRTAGARTAGG